MRKSKADPRNPPIEDLQGQVYQHELGDPDRAEQIDRILGEEGREADAKQRSRHRQERLALARETKTTQPSPQTHKNLLIAIDESEVSERVLAYVAELMHGRHDMRALVLHVPKPVPATLLEFGGRENSAGEKMAQADLQADRTDWTEHERLAAAPIFARARELFNRAGVPEEVVETEILARNPNESLDSTILEVAQDRHCGTIVVGYAAFSRFRKLMQPQLAEVLVKKAPGIAIWIVH
jgi:nucleotide-binding universal stress UspA family protein